MGSSAELYQICTVDEENDLGIMFSRNVKFRSHIHKMVQKANKVLGVINQTFKYQDPNIMRLLYTSLVHPHLDYYITYRFAYSLYSYRVMHIYAWSLSFCGCFIINHKEMYVCILLCLHADNIIHYGDLLWLVLG